MSLLTHIEHQLTGGAVRDPATADTVLQHLESLLRRIGTFRTAHRRLAELNLPLRPTPTGSGGHTMGLLDLLASSTLRARERARRLRGVRRPVARSDAGGASTSTVGGAPRKARGARLLRARPMDRR